MCDKPSDPLMGLKCFSIGGRMVERRQRCLGMTDEERRWRAQWLKDQVLSPEEPRYVPEYYKATTNVFRRLWKSPMIALKKTLEPMVGADAAYILRHAIGKGFLGLALVYLGVYYCKYHANNFEVYRSLEIYNRQGRIYPDHPDYPNIPEKIPSDYYDLGFYSSVLCQDVEIPEPPPPPPPPKVSTGVDEIVCPLPEEEKGAY